MWRDWVECLVSLSSCIGWQYAIAAGSSSPPRTEIKPELFQKDRDRAKNDSFAIGLAGRKSHLLPKIGGARKKWFHQDPVPSTDGWVSFLCPLFQSIFHLRFPLRSKASYCFPHHWGLRTGPCKANLLGLFPVFIETTFFINLPHFSSYPSAFSCAGQPDEALFELPSDIACCERYRNGLTGGCSLSNWYFPYDSDCGLP